VLRPEWRPKQLAVDVGLEVVRSDPQEKGPGEQHTTVGNEIASDWSQTASSRRIRAEERDDPGCPTIAIPGPRARLVHELSHHRPQLPPAAATCGRTAGPAMLRTRQQGGGRWRAVRRG
jgi:hypothetical protein